ncbi:MAG TPA: hypothetical protein VGK31_02285 [Thermoanaerobaculia bacterium]|jgi:hypothetical protein
MPAHNVYYRVDRSYVPDASGDSVQHADPPHFVAGESAGAVARDFVLQDSARLLGSVTELTGDKAVATGWRDGKVFVLFVQRGCDAPPRL